MRIVLTGGGSGGHFYPIIAVAEALRDIVKERRLLEPEIYFFGPSVFDERALFDNDIRFVRTPAGKMRRYFSLLNFFDSFKTAFGILKTVWKLYQLYPDVVFSKGGFGAAPTLVAAKILHIPVVVHDSDAIPGRGTLYASTFARRIALSFDAAREHLPEPAREKVALTGNPVRKDILLPARDGAREFLGVEEKVPVLLILGGSQGSEAINDAVISALPDLVQHYQVVHQTGEAHFKTVSGLADVALMKNERRYRYKPYPYFTPLGLKMAAGATDLVISRAGAGGIYEIASWGVASILIPLPTAAQDHQRYNAFAYAHAGACVVLEQQNLTPHLLISEIDRLFTNPKARNDMAEAAKKFAKPDAARTIAEGILDIALEHAS